VSASATPILDRELPVPPPQPLESSQEPAPRSLRNKVIGIILAVLATLLIALLDASPQQIARGKAPLFGVLYLVLMFLLACFVAVVIHEFGHLTAGWWMGFRFESVRFGPIEITRPLRFSLSRGSWGVVNGLTRMEPTRFNAIRVRMFVMIVGGCIANMASGFTIALLPRSTFFLIALAMVSFGFGISNLVPFEAASFSSDGKRILSLVRPDAAWKRVIAMKKIAAQLRKSVSPAEIQPDVISSAIGIVDHSAATFIAHWVAYHASWEQGPETETARRLEIALQHSAFAPSLLRESLFCDAGSFQAMKRRNLELARAWMDEISETASRAWLRLWVESAILEAQNDFKGALDGLDEIEKHRDQAQQTGSKSLQRWRSELQAKLNASASPDTNS
jgi:hypothetical protein